MLLDSIIVGVVVAGAVVYLLSLLVPRSRKGASCASPCGSCAAKAPTRTS